MAADIFLNVPFDAEFEPLFLAYIAGVSAFGVTPRTALEADTGEARLDRVCSRVEGCRSSFHDLSRVEMSPKKPATPRFNMPFELGLAVAQGRHTPDSHSYYVFESQAGRIDKSLSDIRGVDVHVHDGTPSGLFREIGNVLRLGGRGASTDGAANGRHPSIVDKGARRNPQAPWRAVCF